MQRFLRWYLYHDTDNFSSRTPITFVIGLAALGMMLAIVTPIAHWLSTVYGDVPLPVAYVLAVLLFFVIVPTVGFLPWLIGLAIKGVVNHFARM